MDSIPEPAPVPPLDLAFRQALAPAVGGDPPAVRFDRVAFAQDPARASDQIDGLWARLDLHGVAGSVSSGVAGGTPAEDGASSVSRPPEILLRADADLTRAAEVVGEWVAGTDLASDSPETN
jgi:hypothetical protein